MWKINTPNKAVVPVKIAPKFSDAGKTWSNHTQKPTPVVKPKIW